MSAATAPETHAVEVFGRRVRAVVHGGDATAAAPPLLLLNGIGGHAEMWEPLLERMPDRRLVAIDVPGTGASERSPWPLRMGGVAQVIVRVLDELGITRVDALGYSWGGALAQQLARDEPGLVRRLVLCATTPGWVSLPPNLVAAALLLSPARYLHPRLMQLTLPRIAGGVTRRDPRRQVARQASARLAHRPDPIGYTGQLYALLGWGSWTWLGALPQPALVIVGDDDPVIRSTNARCMAQRLPHGELLVVDGGGHLFLIDEPQSVVPAIEAFLDG